MKKATCAYLSSLDPADSCNTLATKRKGPRKLEVEALCDAIYAVEDSLRKLLQLAEDEVIAIGYRILVRKQLRPGVKSKR